MVTAAAIKAHATELGFDLCGIAPATSLPELGYIEEWIDQGYAGTMVLMRKSVKDWMVESVQIGFLTI